MKAIIYKNINTIALEDVLKPNLHDNEEKGAIIKVLGCGLCGSDMVKLQQGSVSIGTVLGHEVVGVIEEIHSSTNFKKGDTIVLGHHVPCYECVFCRHESYSMCEQFKKTNIIPGGFSEYIFVSEKHLNDTVNLVPFGMEHEVAVFTEPLACCLRAIRRAEVKRNDNVLIIGLGAIGLLMGQAIKTLNAEVTGTDILEDRLKLAKELGFDDAFYAGEILHSAKKSFDVVFLTAGNDKTISAALEYVRDGGKISVFSSVKSFETGFSNNEIYYRDLTVMGSYSPASSDLKNAIELLSLGKINTKNLVCSYNMENINQALEDSSLNKIIKAYINISNSVG